MQSTRLKTVAAGIGAGAMVAMGALTVVVSSPQAETGNLGDGLEITLGETTTETTAPSKPATPVATPVVTATTPEGP